MLGWVCWVEQSTFWLAEAIDCTIGVDGSDVSLVWKVVAKKGEARIALSGLYYCGD